MKALSKDRIVPLPSTALGNSGVCPALDSSLLHYFSNTTLPPAREKNAIPEQKGAGEQWAGGAHRDGQVYMRKDRWISRGPSRQHLLSGSEQPQLL